MMWQLEDGGGQLREVRIAEQSAPCRAQEWTRSVGSASCLAREVVYAKEILRKFSFHAGGCGGW